MWWCTKHSLISRNQQSRACCSKLAATQRGTWCKGLWVSTDLSPKSHIGPRRALIPTEGKQWEGGRALLIRDRIWNGAGSSKSYVKDNEPGERQPRALFPTGPSRGAATCGVRSTILQEEQVPSLGLPWALLFCFVPSLHSFTQRSSIIQ